jgi:hypothetical protein
VEYADRIVRFEVVSRSERLKAFGLREVSRWSYANSSVLLFKLWSEFVEKLRFPVMGDVDLSGLSSGAKRLYASWFSGMDVNALAGRTTIYRHRLAILRAGGPDICLPKPDGDVIAFRRVLSPVVASVPSEFRAFLFDPAKAA